MITPSFALTATERVLPRMALDFTTATLDPRVTLTRTGNTATVINSSGLVAPINADLPRFDYDPTTLQCKGLLIEESRVNLLTYSSDYNDASWNLKTNITLSTGVDDPSGGTGAYTMTATASGGVLQKAPTITSGAAYSGSIWIRRRTGTGTVSLRVAELTLLPVTVTSAWTRVSATNTSASTTGRFAVHLATSGDAVDIWGAQLEAGAFATSYIPTVASQVTRNADVALMTGTNFSDWYNASEGSFVVWSSIPFSSGSGVFAVISDNTNSQRMLMNLSSSRNGCSFRVVNGGVDQANIARVNPFTAGQQTKMVAAYKLNSFATAFNGQAAGTDTSGTVPTVSQIGIGNSAVGTPSVFFNGYFQKILYYPQRLIDAEVQAFSK